MKYFLLVSSLVSSSVFAAGTCADISLERALNRVELQNKNAKISEMMLTEYLNKIKPLHGYINAGAWTQSIALGGAAAMGGYLAGLKVAGPVAAYLSKGAPFIASVRIYSGVQSLATNGAAAAGAAGSPALLNITMDQQNKTTDRFKSVTDEQLKNLPRMPIVTSSELMAAIESYYENMSKERSKLTDRLVTTLAELKKGENLAHLSWDHVKFAEVMVAEGEARRKIYAQEQKDSEQLLGLIKGMCTSLSGREKTSSSPAVEEFQKH